MFTVHRCPVCKVKGRNHGFNLTVVAPVRCHVHQQFHSRIDPDGNVIPYHVQTDPDTLERNPKWDGSSPMICTICGHSGPASEFVSEHDPGTEPLVP